jgi:hypothetical protein
MNNYFDNLETEKVIIQKTKTGDNIAIVNCSGGFKFQIIQKTEAGNNTVLINCYRGRCTLGQCKIFGGGSEITQETKIGNNTVLSKYFDKLDGLKAYATNGDSSQSISNILGGTVNLQKGYKKQMDATPKKGKANLQKEKANLQKEKVNLQKGYKNQITG